MDTVLNIDVAERIRNITNEVLRIDPVEQRIGNEANLYEVGLESLNVVELIVKLEAAYRITIDVEDLSADLFYRFATLVDFVQRKVGTRA